MQDAHGRYRAHARLHAIGLPHRRQLTNAMRKRPKREAYERPKVLRVRIVSGEMAVTGCKVRNGNVGPTLGCQRTACRSIGS